MSFALDLSVRDLKKVELPPVLGGEQPKTSLRAMLRAVFRNDQLLLTAISMGLFMIAYITTASFGVYYFKYARGG